MTRLLTFITDHAGWVLAIVLAITVLSITQIVDVRTGELRIAFDPSTNALLPQDDEGRRFYDYVRTLFGSDETVLVVLVDDDIFTAENLKALQRMAERIETIHGVHHVVSLGNALNIRSQDGDLIIEPFVDVVPTDPTELPAIRRRAPRTPIPPGTPRPSGNKPQAAGRPTHGAQRKFRHARWRSLGVSGRQHDFLAGLRNGQSVL